MTPARGIPWTRPVALTFALVISSGCKGADATADDGDSQDAVSTTDSASAYLDHWQVADLSGADAGVQWSGASAPLVVYQALLPLFMVEATTSGASACPQMNQGPNGVTYQGGCTDASGNIWSGRATSSAAGVQFSDFGLTTPSEHCTVDATMTWTGSVLDLNGDTSVLSVDMVLVAEGADDACVAHQDILAWEYDATYEARENDDWQKWSGQGRMGVKGLGQVELETVDEIIDGRMCSHEPVSGDTYVAAGNTELRFTYDGETDCDPDATITWYRNDEAQGQVTGVACAAVHPAGGLVALVVGAVGVVARRRRGCGPAARHL